MVGGTARLAAGAAAAVALIVASYTIALGGGAGGVGSGAAETLAEVPARVGERLHQTCGCDPVEAIVDGLAGLGEGAGHLVDTIAGAAVTYGTELVQAIHGAGPTGVVGSAPAIAGIAAGALLIAFWRLVTAKADPPRAEAVESADAAGSGVAPPGPAGLPGSFRHVAPSADALIHEADAIDLTRDKSLVEVIAFMIVAAIAVSILLGHFWAQIPLDLLLSQRYFATASMVAAVTGIAFSLLIGGR